jgi:hypothetical protein
MAEDRDQRKALVDTAMNELHKMQGKFFSDRATGSCSGGTQIGELFTKLKRVYVNHWAYNTTRFWFQSGYAQQHATNVYGERGD